MLLLAGYMLFDLGKCLIRNVVLHAAGVLLRDGGIDADGDQQLREHRVALIDLLRDLASGRINIAVLNQTYRFDSVEGTGLTPTHVLVPEGYVLGFENKEDKVYGIQFHLESAPGPQDYVYLFDKFIQMMEEQRHA